MWNEDHLISNIKYAMVMETLGLGPYRYCILSNVMPHFESKVMLLMTYLPRQKLCFYPRLYGLDGPFQRAPWRGWGQVALRKRIKFRHTLAVTIYQAQQIVIYFLTGYFEPSFIWI